MHAGLLLISTYLVVISAQNNRRPITSTQNTLQNPDDYDENNFNMDPQQQYYPSPYASRYQQPMHNLLGNMMMQMPWNSQRSGPSMMMPQLAQGMGVIVGLDKASSRAVAILNGTGIRGTVIFNADLNTGSISISGNITGLPPNSQHGFHVHQYGDLSNGCTSAGGHFNPYNVTHGSPSSNMRHVGDLGNVAADGNGFVNLNITDSLIALAGPSCVVGRAVVVHQLMDDLGMGGNSDSLATGNAGGRLACGVIGYAAVPV